MKKRITAFLVAVMFLLSLAVLATDMTVEAAGANAVQSVAVRIGSKSVAKKTHTLTAGASAQLKVSGSPAGAVKSIRYASKDSGIASVNKNGKVTAKRAGTTRINITVTGRNNKKLSTWVKIKVRERASTPSAGSKKVLVAYFSATNTTKKIAGYIADGLDADLYEIVPEQPYTSADLNYGDSSSRTTIEMNDPDARPAISGKVADMAQYDIVFVGYPIWWGEAPRIISTFLESYDFSGKTIVPFCTSGSSGIGSSAANLRTLTKGADWLAGRRFSGSASRSTVIEWVNGLGLGLTAK